jgi:hypothetical protein
MLSHLSLLARITAESVAAVCFILVVGLLLLIRAKKIQAYMRRENMRHFAWRSGRLPGLLDEATYTFSVSTVRVVGAIFLGCAIVLIYSMLSG